MKNNIIYTENYKGYTINIMPDQDVENPREDNGGNIGILAWFYKRYDYDESGIDTKQFSSLYDIYQYLKKEKGVRVILPVYLYEHSGLRVKIGSFTGLLPQGHAEFDSGQVGFIYTTPERLKELGVKFNIPDIIRHLTAEIETLDNYFTGDVYGYQVLDKEGKEVDSCWGYIGDYDDKEYSALTEARAVVDAERVRWHKRQIGKGFYGRNNPLDWAERHQIKRFEKYNRKESRKGYTPELKNWYEGRAIAAKIIREDYSDFKPNRGKDGRFK